MVYTNKEEKEQFGRLLTRALKKQYPFIMGVEVDNLTGSEYRLEIDCFILVEREFMLNNLKLNCTSGLVGGELKRYINKGEIPTFAFNECSKNIKFKIDEFIKLTQLLFYSLYGKNGGYSTYSVVFKLV